jgi:hypothetical protein
MTKTEILQELQLLTDLASTMSDSFTYNKLTKVKDSLISLWNTEDMYYEEIRNALQMDETFDNLNQLKIR